jgi:hypothetical protein
MSRCTLLTLVGLTACAVAADPSPACPEETIPEYNRREWGRWTDADGDCQDTRQEVLIRDSEIPVTFTDERKCHVAAGRWRDPYDGRVVEDPSAVDVDHVVALRDAHESGGWRWDRARKREFANDLDNLKATSRSTNRSKGAKGPDEWLPLAPGLRCTYITIWVALKETKGLSMSDAEVAVLNYMNKVCFDGDIPPLPQN